MKRPLTVIIPCKNERLNIVPCIESLWDLATEIIVADSGSTDETMDLAGCFEKVRIIEREYITSGDFKNWAIPQASHDWILLLDADERVTPQLAAEIQMLLSRGPECDGYWIRRSNFFLGHRLNWGDARRDKVCRLFRRDVSRYEGPSDHGEVHVQSGKVGELKNPMLHYSIWSYDQLNAKHLRYTKLQAKQWHEAGKDTSWFSLLTRPAFRFLREYFLHLGILDGKAGIQQAWIAATYSFTKQARLWELNHGLPQPGSRQEDWEILVPSEQRRAA